MIEKNQLLSSVSSDHLMDFTTNISKEVRLSGSAEEKRSFEYAESVLKGFGYNTNLYYRPALISLPGDSQLKVDDQIFTSITHSMAISTSEKGLTAELVYVGDENYADSISVHGKAVLIDGLATPGAVRNAESRGAVAAIFINAQHTHEMIVSTVWGNPSLENRDEYPNSPVASVNFL